MPTWILEPRDTLTPDPDCWHCVNNPDYPHRHWRQAEPAAEPRQPGRIWRALFRLYGGGS